MNLTLHFCTRSLRQIKHLGARARICNTICTSRIRYCTKLSAVRLSQTTSKKISDSTTNAEQIEVLLIKNLLAGNKISHRKESMPRYSDFTNILTVERSPCTSEDGQCNYKNQLVWQDILLGPKHIGKHSRDLEKNSGLIGINHEMWYCNILDSYPKQNLREGYVHCTEGRESLGAAKQKSTQTGPSSDQLSMVLLTLREELPNFFEGSHRYSIYSKEILFVNKLTRTTTRLFWTKASLDILHITKHTEDNTIKVRWTAKGIPWLQLPFLILSGKAQSLFYRYVDGFSIFEVGRDGLVHCHRLDKVMPLSTPERQKWSIRMQVLAWLGLGEIVHEPCEAFQVKSEQMLK